MAQEPHEIPATRHAVVTGGGRGIGAAVARRLAADGHRLSLFGRDQQRLEATAAEIAKGAGVEVAAIGCDVSDADSVTAAFAAARQRFGAVSILVNNAGQAQPAAFADMKRALWDRMLAVNLTGVFLCTQQALPDMLAAKHGRVVSIASTSGLRGYKQVSAYCAAKHGVIGLTRALALETARQGITVNAVCPGYTDTDMAHAAATGISRALGKSEAEARAMLVAGIPQGRLMAPEEIAETVAFLCGPLAAGITGQAIAVAGGEVM
jgi:NAD(P)-dependent dehydrogenase (short-subunit alcohol dehydrogenase family)